MSEIADKAALEAATSEAELTDAETAAVHELVSEGRPVGDAVQEVLAQRETETEPQPEPPAVAAETGEPTETQLRKLERQVSTHLDKVRLIMGGHVAGFEACSKCGGIGLDQPGPEPQTNDLFEACPICQGFGDVLTGSLKEGNQTRPCPECRGRGYLEAVNAEGVPLAPDGGVGGISVPDVAQLVPAGDTQTADNGGGAVRMGTPAWMGDTGLGG